MVVFLLLFFLVLLLNLRTPYLNICILYNPSVIRLPILVMLRPKLIILILFLKRLLVILKLNVGVMQVLQRTIFKKRMWVLIKLPLSGAKEPISRIIRHICRLTFTDNILWNFLNGSINNVLIDHVNAIGLIHALGVFFENTFGQIWTH